MAEEIRVQREDTTSTTDPEEARADIEQTRSRMSETIDEIEGALSRKREQIQDKLDVFAPIREKPLPSLGAAFGAGLLLGLVTGGDDDGGRSHDYDEEEDGAEHWEKRSRTWENRARRLRDIGREQEEEIHDLQERYGEVRSESLEGRPRRGSGRDDFEEGSHAHGGGSGLREQIMHSLTGYLTHSFGQMAGGSGSGSASA